MKDEKTFGFLIDQNQIGVNVAITIAFPFPFEGMVLALWRKWFVSQ